MELMFNQEIGCWRCELKLKANWQHMFYECSLLRLFWENLIIFCKLFLMTTFN